MSIGDLSSKDVGFLFEWNLYQPYALFSHDKTEYITASV